MMRFNEKVLAFMESIEGKQITIGKDKYTVENISKNYPSYVLNLNGRYHATVFLDECSEVLLSVGAVFMGCLVRSKVLISNITVLEEVESEVAA